MIEMQSSFKQIISEIKGDIYKFKGDKEKSLEFYNEAISASAINNENLLMKKNSVEN
jgi:predicted negative regulator of RcsB-dependent stress response